MRRIAAAALIGMVVAVPVGAASLSESSVIRVRLERKVALARHAKHRIRIYTTALERRRWDRFYVINQGTRQDIDRVLGFIWKDAPEAVPRGERDESLLVFTQRRHVVAYTFYPDKRGRLDCLSN
jgi:hypothetical protein